MRSASMFTSPISLTMTANLIPFLLAKILLSSVVLPLPRYPAKSRTGISFFVIIIFYFKLQFLPINIKARIAKNMPFSPWDICDV